MKLYTKEQVTNVFQKYWLTSGVSNELEKLLEQEKSIELPSVEFINNHIEDNFYNSERIHKYTEKQQLLMKATTKAGALWLNGWIKEQINKTK